MAKNLSVKNYYEENYHNYRQPWEETKEGCWIVIKKDGVTSMRKIEGADYPQLEFALARCYDIVVKRIIDFMDNKNHYFSPSDLALDTINGLRKLAIEQNACYNNNTKGD